MAWWESKKGADANQAPGFPKGVKTWETKTGGYRRDEDNNSYHLNVKQLMEFETKNSEIVDDEEFFAWFADFRKREKIESDRYSYRRGSVSWDKDEPEKKGKWLSSWWANDAHYGFKSSNDKAMKLAIALKPINTLIRIIDDNVPPMRVVWAENGMSYTDYEKGTIAINPKPVMNAKQGDGGAIDVSCGFALHEASHSQRSRPLKDVVFKPTEVRPLQISSMLLNIVEDARIEAATAAEFPGFAGYFQKSLEWLWKDMHANLPKSYGPDLKDKINTLITAIRWAPFAEEEKLWDAWSVADKAEVAWWQDWGRRYLDGADARAIVEEGMAHLRIPTEEEKGKGAGPKGDGTDGPPSGASSEMDKMSEEEKRAERLGNDIREWIKKKIKELQEKGYLDSCPSPDARDGVDSATATAAKQLVDEQLTEDHPVIMHEGGDKPRLFITKPLETEGSRRAYVGKPDPILQRLKAALRFRQALPEYNLRLLEQGKLDEDQLYRWKLGDYRVFDEKVITHKPETQLGLLVDLSGSMMGPKLKTAQQLAQLFVWALKGMDGVTTTVWGHTGDVGTHGECSIYRLWEKGDPLTRIGLVSSLPHYNNYDGYAIDWCVRQLQKMGNETEQRVLIVLSDGYPSASIYGGTAGMNHVRAVTDWADKHGVSVIQIAIDDGMDPARQAHMFKRWMPYEGTQQLPRKLEKLLEKLT